MENLRKLRRAPHFDSVMKDSYKIVGDLAKFYDAMLTNSTLLGNLALKIFWGLNSADYQKFLAQAFAGLPKNFNGRLIEVPVGTGALSLPIYKNFDGAEIFCVDFSEKMLAAAKIRSEKLNLRGVKFFQGDVANLPFEENFFDLVLSINGFHAFAEKNAAWTEIHRVLKFGGIFCGCMYVTGENRRTDFFIENFCEPRGFFCPPYETFETLEKKLREKFSRAQISLVKSFAGFVCTK